MDWEEDREGLEALPVELALHVVAFLGVKDVALALSLVSRRWHAMAESDAVWRQLVRRYYPSQEQLLSKRKENTWKQKFYLWKSIDLNWMQHTFKNRKSIDTTHELQTVAFDESQDCLVTGSQRGAVTFWKLSTAEQVKSHTKAHTGWCRAIRIIGDRVWSCCDDKTVQLWTIDGTPIGETQDVDHSGILRCIDVTQDKRLLATAANDGKVNIMDIETWQILKTFSTPGMMRVVQFAESESGVIGGGDDGVKCWDLRDSKLSWDSKHAYSHCWSLRYVEPLVFAGGDHAVILDARKLPGTSQQVTQQVEVIATLRQNTSTIFSLWVGPGKDRVVLGDDGGVTVLTCFDAYDPQLRNYTKVSRPKGWYFLPSEEPEKTSSPVPSLQFNERYLVTVSWDRHLRIFDFFG
jgi:WD40 repeat protein